MLRATELQLNVVLNYNQNLSMILISYFKIIGYSVEVFRRVS